eukprot:scaffold96431_cov18-Tisochrysis_lutea.AAC.2
MTALQPHRASGSLTPAGVQAATYSSCSLWSVIAYLQCVTLCTAHKTASAFELSAGTTLAQKWRSVMRTSPPTTS